VGLRLSQNAEADALLQRDPLALLIGMLLDQQVPMEWAFTGPYSIVRRMGRHDLDVREIASFDPDEFAALLSQKPAIHRYPGAMARRIQRLCQYIANEYAGDTAALWRDVPDGAELFRRLSALPGYGKQKAQIFIALLGKQLGVQPEGWREAAGAYGEDGSRRSVADVVDADTLIEVRTFKQQMKRKAKA
jgi:uncharacterized HhH-GPD family protein